MYDPTIFDNLKVAFENYIYDLDNLDEMIAINHRIDRIEMSVMAREFAMCFSLRQRPDVSAKISLQTSVQDLASEILERDDDDIGCLLSVQFQMHVSDVEKKCPEIEEILADIWQPEVPITQTLSWEYGKRETSYENLITVSFPSKINEEQMEQIPEFIDHVLWSLRKL
ncbi:hypothetical protein [Bacillus sp. FJAT-45037]|uniref:hypothetical protein n=1 Tax=Bacillus sp. FJAT-45037 TaxID=2011007 RepID=UPI000C232A27|nr:hypothetical protein [Bacillus sp. FJAT-45037]